MNVHDIIINKKISTLILGPGGVKGLLELGALKYLSQRQLLSNVTTIVGISIGSIIGFFMSIGMNIDQIIVLASIVTPFSDFSGSASVTIEKITNIISKWGLLDTASLKTLISDISRQYIDDAPTFTKIFEKTGIKLVIVASNLSKNKAVHFSIDSFPNMNAIDAIMLSINIPILFGSIAFENDLFVDGALIDPFPINRYIDNCDDNITLGLYIEENCIIDSLFSYINAAISLPINTIRENIIKNIENDRIVIIGLKSPIINIISLESEKRIEMVKDGFNQIKIFFQ